MTHSEPAREAVALREKIADFIDENAEVRGEHWSDHAVLVNADELAASIVELIALAWTASPAPAAGGLEGWGMDLPLANALREHAVADAINRARYRSSEPGLPERGVDEEDPRSREYAFRLAKAALAALASPAATLVSHKAAIGETQAASCSTDGTEAPAATSAETQGGDGVREAAKAGWNACRKSLYAVCEDVVSENERHRDDIENPPRHHFGRGGMTAAKSIARGFNSMEAEDDDNFTAALAALAPSTSAATRGEPVAWRWRPRVGGLWIYDPELEWLERQGDAIEKQPLYASPPAPAVESAQVKEALDVAREYVVDGLSAQDQKRRDVEGYPGLMEREQGRLDEVRADLALVDRIRASLATDAEG